jgi:hypothetical protein
MLGRYMVQGETFFKSIEHMQSEYAPVIYQDCVYFSINGSDNDITIAFQNDIKTNLKAWAVDNTNKTIFYRTKNYWYAFKLSCNDGVLLCSQFSRKKRKGKTSKSRKNCWILPTECNVGREWLQDLTHKRIPLIPFGIQIRMDFKNDL